MSFARSTFNRQTRLSRKKLHGQGLLFIAEFLQHHGGHLNNGKIPGRLDRTDLENQNGETAATAAGSTGGSNPLSILYHY